MFPSCARVDAPPSEKDDVRTTDVCAVTVARQWRCSGNSHPCPLVFFSVEDANIVEVAGLKLSSLTEICSFLDLFVKGVSALNDHIGSHLNRCMSHAFVGNRAFAFRLSPRHHFEIKHEEVVEVFLAVSASENEYFSLVYQYSSVAVASGWRTDTFWTLKPGHSDWI